MKRLMITAAVLLLSLLQTVCIYAESYEYDSMDRVTKVIYDDGSSVTYEYDASGNMTGTQVYEPEEEKDVLQKIVDAAAAAVQKAVHTVIDFLRQIFGR